jgi:hypothetical protein
VSEQMDRPQNIRLYVGQPPKGVKRYFWDEEGNRVHRARGKLKNGVWYTPIVLASDYDTLQEHLADAAHRVRWLMQFANVDKEPIEQELAKWEALSSAKATP